jgi:hypothetical protein
MNLDGFATMGRMYIIARRIALGIVLLVAAGVGVTVYRLQHQPVYYDTTTVKGHYVQC